MAYYFFFPKFGVSTMSTGANVTQFVVNGKYNFEVFPAALLGNDFKNVVVLGIVHPAIAQNFLDIEAMHVQVYPYLPTGTPNDARGYDYIMIRTISGTTTVLGMPWINADTITNVEAGTMVVELVNVTSQDIQRVSDALIANGFNQFNIKMRTN